MRKTLSSVFTQKLSKYSEKVFIQVAAVPRVNDAVFLPLPPCRPGCWVKQRSAPMSRLHDTPMARIHRCQGSYYWKKLLLKWNEDQRPQRALLSTESGICLQESCSSDSTLGACYLLLIHETTPNRAKAAGKEEQISCCCRNRQLSLPS